jgi:plastocyanin
VKRTLLLLLAVPLMLGLLVACGDDDDDDDGGTTTTATSEPADEATAEPTDEATAEPTDEATEEPPAGGDGVVELSAANVAFNTDELSTTAGEVTIEFTNNDSLPHNVGVYADEGFEENIFAPDGIVEGGGSATYEVGELEPAEYYFRCEVHPGTMTGVLIVE